MSKHSVQYETSEQKQMQNIKSDESSCTKTKLCLLENKLMPANIETREKNKSTLLSIKTLTSLSNM